MAAGRGDCDEGKLRLPPAGKAKTPQLLAHGTLLKGRWEVEELMAEGGFGQIYRAVDRMGPGRRMAVKAEPLDAHTPLLRMEIQTFRALIRLILSENLQSKERVLKEIQGRDEMLGTRSRHFLRLADWGTHPKAATFIVMDLVGRNLMELKKSRPEDRLSPQTSLRLALQMTRALQDLHATGWLHRDVKPSNFCIGRHGEGKRQVFLIDFGLCRQYRNERGEVRPPRPKVGFRGTVRYASLRIHLGQDMGRGDDLWSLFYILVEQILGQLPWRKVSDKVRVREMKEETNYADLLRNTPIALEAMRQDLTKLTFHSEPDYSRLTTHFSQELARLHVRDSDPFDWEGHPDAFHS